MILTAMNNTHHKHPKMSRPASGEFGRNELAFCGSSCGTIRQLACAIISRLTALKVAYVDADHAHSSNQTFPGELPATAISNGASLEYTNKVSFHRIDSSHPFTPLQRKALFNEQDLVLVNGNHFTAQHQVVIIDAAKPMEHKLDRLTDVRLIVLKDKISTVPAYLQSHIASFASVPVLGIDDESGITELIAGFVKQRIPELNGLVLAGGLSTRMQADKGDLKYYGKSQRQHVLELLAPHCKKVFVSCNPQQSGSLNSMPLIEDRFAGLGPMNGILSAMQHDPNAAWLILACDLPFLSAGTLQYLVQHRNPNKTATAFMDPEGRFPEPLITIWEPRSYPLLLQWLGMGYNCPRKVLINADVALLQAPDTTELQNVNDQGAYTKAVRDIKNKA